MSPVGIEQLVDTDGVVGAEGRSVHAVRDFPCKVWLGAAVGALLGLPFPPGPLHLEARVEAGVGGLEPGLHHLERTGHDGPGSSSNPEKIFELFKEVKIDDSLESRQLRNLPVRQFLHLTSSRSESHQCYASM